MCVFTWIKGKNTRVVHSTTLKEAVTVAKASLGIPLVLILSRLIIPVVQENSKMHSLFIAPLPLSLPTNAADPRLKRMRAVAVAVFPFNTLKYCLHSRIS